MDDLLKNSTTNPLKALDILEALSQCPKGAGVTELADITGLSKSSVHRILMALVERRYVEKNEITKQYRLGFRPLTLASAVLDSLEIKHIARNELKKISNITGETVHLMCIDGLEALYVDKIDTPDPVGLKSQIGKRLPLYCTGGGKAMLAFKGDAFIQNYIKSVSFVKYTPATLTSPQEILSELEHIREVGYAIDNEEHHTNIHCIAVPLVKNTHEVVASISISAPAYRFPIQQAIQYKDLLIDSAKNIIGQLL